MTRSHWLDTCPGRQGVPMTWVFDVPPALVCVVVVGAFVALSLAGMSATRARMHRAVPHPHLHNDLVGFFLAALGVFYGLLLGLVAVAAWEQHAEAEAVVTREATALAALYRDISVYPEPDKSELEGLIDAYLQSVIDEEWPMQRGGVVPAGGVIRAANLEQRLARFEPTGAGETVMHEEAMREFNTFYEARRQRLDAVDSRLPSTLWWVMITGGLIIIAITWLFVFAHPRVQALLTAGMAAMIGLLVFLSVAMDRPFRGKFAIGSEPFELVRSQLVEGHR